MPGVGQKTKLIDKWIISAKAEWQNTNEVIYDEFA